MNQLTITQEGKVLTETQEGITMPADYSFATVNDYVHGIDRTYEELECLCLGMACHIDKQEKQHSIAIEPFGYFKAEPFGWTDCAETDDGAQPLYEQQTIDALTKQRDELLAEMQKAREDMSCANFNSAAGRIDHAIASVKGGAA